ncbi:hypothetical protein ACH492_27875 [Streptomyces sp. NPDC019443]|uniref:hypothetical protein n=1 Tax=Streptomyces sp. NPDC019443 TaxID=3365061 RepID=UPI0037AF6D55
MRQQCERRWGVLSRQQKMDAQAADRPGMGCRWEVRDQRVIRVRDGGAIVADISTGDLGVFACALGGEDGRTLYLSAAPSFAEHQRKNTRDAVLVSCRVDVPR